MHECKFEGEQDKCPGYVALKDKPPHVDLTCKWFREHWLDDDNGSICQNPRWDEE